MSCKKQQREFQEFGKFGKEETNIIIGRRTPWKKA
jgi:hypothetical protein